MEPLLYVLIALVSVLLVLLVINLVIVIKRKPTAAGDVKVDQKETLTQLNFVQKELANLKLEMDKAFESRFSAQTEKLSESDAKFLKEMREELDNKLALLNKSVETKLRLDAEKGEKTFEDLGKKMQEIVTANKEVISLGEDVKKLNEVISGGGARKGKFGEFLLESILEEVYAGTVNMYSTQHSINGVRPDAVIFLPREKGNLLCIDAKFAYDNFARMQDEDGTINESYRKQFKADVKTKIDEIKNKYIIKGETIDYALCFFPSDDIFQFIHTAEDFKDIVTYARRHNVVLVSPSTLQPTLHTLKALMIEFRRSQKLAEVNEMIIQLARDFKLLEDRYNGFMQTYDALLNKRGPLDITVNKLTKQFSQIKDDSEINED